MSYTLAYFGDYPAGQYVELPLHDPEMDVGSGASALEREMGTKELAQWIAYDRYRAGR